MKQVGLVGVGLLGSAIAYRLRRAGYAVIGLDPDPAHHGQVDRVAAHAADLPSTVVVCLPDSGVTAQLVEPLAQKGRLVIDATTGTPSEMASFGERFAAAGARYLDCTVAASSQQVKKGEALVMVGGQAEAFAEATPLLAAFAERMVHVGGWGSGARMKLVINLALGLQRAALSEALGFAEACGIDQALALDLLQDSPAQAKVMEMKGPRMLERRYAGPDARLRQHHKDVRLILEEGAAAGARLPLSTLHAALLAEAESAGWADLDNSVVRELFRKGRPV